MMALRPDERAGQQQSRQSPLDNFCRRKNSDDEKGPHAQWPPKVDSPKWGHRIGKRRRSRVGLKENDVNASNGNVPQCDTSEHQEIINCNTDTNNNKGNNVLQTIVDDFTGKGDRKILRAIGRTATVNAAVLVTAATGGAASAVGFITGGAITAKRLGDGVINDDEKEVAKSLAVYSCATGASVVGQAVTGALMLGVAGASLPLAGAVAFGVGCCSGITAGALSEWTVDSVVDAVKKNKNGNSINGAKGQDDNKMIEMVDMSSKKSNDHDEPFENEELGEEVSPSMLRSIMHM
mmetsp:Transcript_34285/g.100855  ORF Transcript_34285/g.100855 Transcript_34285/m.100855 type:complete len:293 (+) Transcript_34285:117-995(+)